MTTDSIRFIKPDIPYDALNLDAKWLNFGVGGSEAKFPANVDNVAGWFKKYGYIVNAQNNINMEYNGTFTLMFWAKCVDFELVDSIYGVQWILVLNNGTNIRVKIPDIVDLTEWNHYSIVRDEYNNITFRVNGTSIKRVQSNEVLDLNDKSYMWFGSKYNRTVGDEVILDDILLFDGVVYTEDFDELPTDYIDVSQFKRLLYIITTTGEVWGYSKEE